MNPSRSFRSILIAAVAAFFICFAPASVRAEEPVPPPGTQQNPPAPKSEALPKPAARREDVEPDTLPSAKTALKTARDDRDKAEGDLEAERAEHDRTKQLLSGALDTCRAAQTDRDTAQGSLAAATRERDDERASHGKTREKLTLAEGLCQVRGVDPAKAVPAAATPEAKKTVADYNTRLAAATTPQERNAVLKEFGEKVKAGEIAEAAKS